MKQYEYVVTEPEGLHALPATALVAKLNTYESEITASFNGKIVNAKSPFGLMSLGARCGDVIIFRATGFDEANLSNLFLESL